MGRRHCGQRRNYWLRVISPFPKEFAKRIVKEGLISLLNVISVVSRQPSLHLSMPSWVILTSFLPIFLPNHWLLSHITTIETMDSGEKGMNPVAMTNPQKGYWLSQGSNQWHSFFVFYQRARLSFQQRLICHLQMLSIWLHPKFCRLIKSWLFVICKCFQFGQD